MCIANNVPVYEHEIEEHDNLGMMRDQEILADNRNIDLMLGRQQRDKIIRCLYHRNDV